MTRLPPDYDPRVTVAKKHADSNKLYLFYYLPDGTRSPAFGPTRT